MQADVSILNVGEGDTKLSFDPDKPVECERAARIVTDMLRRGCAISIYVDGRYVRAKGFDPKTCEYLIDGLSPQEEAEIAQAMSGKKKRGRPKRIPASSVPAVSIPRTARGCSPGSWA
jgi:hypothetical protein